MSQMGGGLGGQGMGAAGTGGQRGGAGGGRGGRGGASGFRPRSQNRPAVLFVPSATGPEPRHVMLGYSDLDFTEVVSGLKAGDQVYLVTAARLLQLQKENDARMRARMGGPIPGMAPIPGGQRGPGGPGGGGGGNPGRGN